MNTIIQIKQGLQKYMLKQYLMLIAAVFVFSAAALSEEKMDLDKNDEVIDFNQPALTSDFDFNLSSPEEFLEFLKKGAHLSTPGNPFAPFVLSYTVNHGATYKWIKPEHISRLISLINSQEPCMPVMSMYSSKIPTKLSTIGDEAMHLIEGFRKQKYPPNLNSRTYSSKERDETLQWWYNWNKQNIKGEFYEKH